MADRGSNTTDGSVRPIWLLIDAAPYGGIERHVQSLTVALNRRAIPAEFVLYEDRGQNALMAQLKAANAPLRILDGTFGGLLKSLREHRPALLHTHGYKANILGRIAARLAGIPHLASFHSPEKAKFPVSLYYFMDNYSAPLSHRISVSEEIGRKVLFGAPTIPNFIQTPAAVTLSPLPRRVGLVGRLIEQKAPEIFCEIAKAGPRDLEWHVYGDGPLRRSLEEKYAGAVTFHGAVGDMAPVWASLGLLLMPSNSEGLPLAALESLSAGVPVAATPVGGVPTLVVPGTSGWLFPRGDVEAGLRAVNEWASLDTEAQRRLRKSCWTFVRDNFSEEAIIPRMLEAYQRAGCVLPVQKDQASAA
jgi:glycosyltransferase involved in cell wall biosynthesis